MERSLSNSILLCLCVILISCSNCKKSNTGTETENTERRRGERGTPQEAPPHNAPDQDRIDSLKREKQKERDR